MSQEDALETAFGAAQNAQHSYLSTMGPLILAASHLGIAKDSRGFARLFDLAHALVIRECTSLEQEFGLIETQKKDIRTSRVFYHLTEKGRALFEHRTPAHG
ncbi:hypothetical protein [Celeribacter naphthalenivorans]|uniref:hypothetical protein n=1 Tax=Celeribacter naphthalenivorans TaxID=1614694 RepID=UPI001CFB5533|nr:hypothetical protein [Celeribacter naphthalenivorans]